MRTQIYYFVKNKYFTEYSCFMMFYYDFKNERLRSYGHNLQIHIFGILKMSSETVRTVALCMVLLNQKIGVLTFCN
jgi:hypothetical protein